MLIFKNLLYIGFITISLFPLLPLKSNNHLEKSCKNAIKKELKNLTLAKTKLREPKISRTKVIDINDDLRKEILIEQSYGGNCCPPVLKIIFFNLSCKAKKIKLEKFDNVWGGWESVNFKKIKDDLFISATNNTQGIGYRDLNGNDVEYIFNGRNLNFLSRTVKKESKAIIEMRTSNLKKNMPDHQETFLMIDLNNDKQTEKISCKYWERWGTFRNCLIKKDDIYLQIGQNINPKRLGILKEKKNGWKMLVIDYDEKYFFDPETNNFEKLNNPKR
tara:strand:+ start:550 stop:1374 length:825 start_codon:yes stop_codon:yes gene_type:complete